MRQIIRAKLAPPMVADHVVARPRVEHRLAGLFTRASLVRVCATAGAGKTSAVLLAAARDARPLAWLTLDDSDSAPGRLLTYLEAAIADHLPGASGLVAGALAEQLPHAEVAGLLAQELDRTPLLLVIDELERIADAPDALAVVRALGRYAPRRVTIVLVGRRELPGDLGTAGIAIGERELAFTPEEAASALERVGHAELDATGVVDVTGGWVAGVLFEAWRSEEHVLGAGGESDPLYGYLSHQIMAELAPAEQGFLLRTSLLDELTAEAAEALGEQSVGERLRALRAQHLPATWNGSALRLHPRFRDYLRERLAQRGEREVARLRAALARLRIRQGHHEEAVDELLRAGLPDEASAAAAGAIDRVVERLDFEIADRWLGAWDRDLTERTPSLWRAELMSAIGQWQFERGAALADRLCRRDDVELDATTAAMLAWCYYHVGRLDDMRALLAAYADAPPVAVARRALLLLCDAEPDRAEIGAADPGGPLAVLDARGLYHRGYLPQVEELTGNHWAASLSAPHRVSCLRALGRTSEALRRAEDAIGAGQRAVWLQAIARVEVLIDLGRGDDARRALHDGRALIAPTGSRVMSLLRSLLEAKLLLRLERDAHAALARLDALERTPGARAYAFVAEQIDCWYGQALLLLGHDRAARERLEAAVASMRAGDRGLELPTAAVYLSEARWRSGDEDGADAAGELALAACERLGSRHLLLQALADQPAVATRRSDAQAGSESVWHELGRTLIRCGVAVTLEVGSLLRLEDFGPARMLVNGAEVRPRIRKSTELLAYLTTRRDRAAPRDELLHALFAGRGDAAARSYLRQSILQLREALADVVGLEVDDRWLRIAPSLAVDADSLRFEALVAEADRLVGEDRLQPLVAALALYERGDYLFGATAEWIDRRRRQLSDVATDARLAAGEATFVAGRHGDARGYAAAALADDPYRERGWRLLMRTAAAVGDHDGVIAAYRRCHATLAALDVEPAADTHALLATLRGPLSAPPRRRARRP